jgi:PAS domain S-box-containing protein
MEDELLTSHHRLESAMEAGNIAWWEMDCTTGDVTFSERKARMLGYQPEQFSHYSDFTRLLHPDDYEPTMQAMRDHLSGAKGKYDAEYRIRTSNGEYRWFHDIGGVSGSDRQGTPLRATGLVIDITERKLAEESVKEANAWLKRVQKGAKAGFWDWDMPAGKLTWSEEFFILFGLPAAAEPSFETWLAVLHPDDRAPALEKIERAVEERKDLWNEYRILLPGGEHRWIGASGITTYDGAGAALRMSGICLDITIEESEQRYRGLINGVPDYILVHRNGKILFVNPAAAKILGNDASAIAGTDIVKYITPESRGLVAEMMLKRAAGETVPPYEITIIPREGVKRVTEVHGALIMYQGKEASLNVLSDITERKQAEERLRESEEKYRALLFGAGIGVGYWSPDGTLLFLNEISLKRLKGKEEDFIGKNMREMFGDAAEKYLERFKKTAISPDPLEYEDYISLPSGEGWYLSVYSRITGLDGSVKGVQVLSIDITDRKQGEEMRERLLIDLQQKNAELERFTYTVSHDLKSPLITIKGFLGYLEKDACSGDTGRLHEDIVRIHAATSKMEEFIASLLELSRVGRIVNPPASIPLSSLVQDAVETLDAQVRKRGVTIRVPGDLPEVYGDRVRLQQVMTNLIENSIKFMGDQKEPIIEIRVSTRDMMKTICVKDNGIGIAPENLDTVFSVFKRLNPAIQGTGIGLALVRRIIEVHGGKCWAESPGLGGGSTFCFSLPEKPPAS